MKRVLLSMAFVVMSTTFVGAMASLPNCTLPISDPGQAEFCANFYGMQVNKRVTSSVRFEKRYDPITKELTTYNRVTREHASQEITVEDLLESGDPSDWAGAN